MAGTTNERTPLLVQNAKANEARSLAKQSTMLGRTFIRGIYLLSGQYVFPKKSLLGSTACMLYFFSVSFIVCWTLNIVPFVVTILDWAACPTKYYDVCYSIILHPDPNTTDIPEIVLLGNTKSLGEDASSLISAQNELKKFETYAKLVLLITAFSSAVSYLMFFIAFTQLYFLPHLQNSRPKKIVNALSCCIIYCCCIKRRVEKDTDIKPLHPFDDEDESEPPISDLDNNTSTQLTWSEVISYYGMLITNITINLAMLIVFVYGQYIENPHKIAVNEGSLKNDSNLEVYEIAFVSVYTYSLLCTLLSCYIFSKIAYGIQRKYKSFEIYLRHVNEPQGSLVYETHITESGEINERSQIYDYLETNTDRTYKETDELHVKLYYLQERDKHFSRIAKKTIKVFERWFFFHWVLYIVSSFLSLSLFLETIIHYIDSTLPNQKTVTTGIHFHHLEIIFLGLFSASNCLFFLYPCVRAASITDSRNAQIRHINQNYTKYEHITPEFKDMFVSYLSSQNFGFDLHILCAKVPFGFSVAYISIFIALFGVLLKVVSSV